MGRGSGQTFLQRRHADGQQTHEKVPSITDDQENANQNRKNATAPLSEWLLSKRQQRTCVGQGVGKREPSCCWSEGARVQPVWEALRLEVDSCTEQRSTSGCVSKETEASVQRPRALLCSLRRCRQELRARGSLCPGGQVGKGGVGHPQKGTACRGPHDRVRSCHSRQHRRA